MTYRDVSLFSGSSVAQLLAEQRAALDEAIAVATENVSDRKHWESAFRVEPIILQRSRAEFDVQEHPGNVATVLVTLTVPWTGDARLLLAGRTASSGHPQPSVSVSDPPAALIMINQKFTGPTADDVRAWARPIIDDIEAVTAAQTPEVERFNELLPEVAGALLTNRRQVLGTIDLIRKSLGKGI